jgi:23S rRNA (guanosine2251-2'-O)-methyltransferase
MPKSKLRTTYTTVEGRNPVLEALKASHPMHKILIAVDVNKRQRVITEIIAHANRSKIPLIEVERKVLDSLAVTSTHQGVIAFVQPYKYVTVNEIIDFANAKGEEPFIFILDRLEDPQNLGTILRIADGAGVHGVIISAKHSVGLTPTVAKASTGAIEYVLVAKVTNLHNTIEKLKNHGIWIVGTSPTADKMYFHTNLLGPVAFVIGGEFLGISKIVQKACDFIVKIPMHGKIECLNAAIVAGILAYEKVRQEAWRKHRSEHT